MAKEPINVWQLAERKRILKPKLHQLSSKLLVAKGRLRFVRPPEETARNTAELRKLTAELEALQTELAAVELEIGKLSNPKSGKKDRSKKEEDDDNTLF